MRLQIEKKTRFEREEKGEIVREEGNRREGARREMRHAVLEGQIEGNRVVANFVGISCHES